MKRNELLICNLKSVLFDRCYDAADYAHSLLKAGFTPAEIYEDLTDEYGMSEESIQDIMHRVNKCYKYMKK